MVGLGTLGGNHSNPFAVNAAGQAVGYAFTADNAELHAFSWAQAGGMVDLGTFGGTGSAATAVNAAGRVVGVASTIGDLEYHAVVWNPNRPTPTDKSQCMKGGWQNLADEGGQPFENQGACLAYMNR